MIKTIKCEECGKRYIPRENFNPACAFAWCPKCLNDYEKETDERFGRVIRNHLKTDFDNEYEREKFAWGLIK